MSKFILIRWVLDNALDVCPLSALENKETRARLRNDADAIGRLRGSRVVVKRWEEPEEAIIIDAGLKESMKKRRTWLTSEAASESQAHPQNALCCQHQGEARELREEIQRLEEDNERLTEQLQSSKERLRKAEEMLDCCDMAKDLRRGLKRLRAIECTQSAAKVNLATLVDIGNSVLVNEAALMRAREKNKGAGPFARALLGLVFSEEELVERSLTGRKSNAHKDAVAKEALDPVRLNAIIAHTIREYGDVEKQVKASLSSFLCRGH